MGRFYEIISTETRNRLSIAADMPFSLDLLNAIEYEPARYSVLGDIFEIHDLNAIKSLSSGSKFGVSDYLLIYQFKQSGVSDRLVMVLDKFDPWANPEVLDIF